MTKSTSQTSSSDSSDLPIKQSRAMYIWPGVLALVLGLLFIETKRLDRSESSWSRGNLLISAPESLAGSTVKIDNRPVGLLEQKTDQSGSSEELLLRLNFPKGDFAVTVEEKGGKEPVIARQIRIRNKTYLRLE